MQVFYDLLINLISDLIAWIIVGAALSLFVISNTARRRRGLFNFFGISSLQPRIQVYITRVNVKPGGATMIGGEEWLSFTGPVISAREFKQSVELLPTTLPDGMAINGLPLAAV